MKTKKALGGLLGLLGSFLALVIFGFLLTRSDPFLTASLQMFKNKTKNIRSLIPEATDHR